MVDSAEFSKRLQLIMEKHDLNASSFAEKIGVGRSSMSHILSGRNKPSLDFVLGVLKKFEEVDLYWLLNGRGDYPKTSLDDKDHSKGKTVEASLPSPSGKINRSTDRHKKEDLNKDQNYNTDLKNLGKNISRVILFYEDGTFENFIP